VLALTSEVLAIDMPDRAGALADIARRLARAGVNIEYAYGSGPAREGRAVAYMHVSDLRKAQAALGKRKRRASRRRQ
jgi:hypothetical protein